MLVIVHMFLICYSQHIPFFIVWFINRPGVAGAVLQAPLSFIYSFINWFRESSFSSRSSNHFPAQTVRECSPNTTWHMSCVICHVSYVTCHMSHVTCHMSFCLFLFFFGQSGGASCWRVCYQRGLPRLFCFYILI